MVFAEGRAVAAAFSGKVPMLAAAYAGSGSANVSRQWISGALAIPAAGFYHAIIHVVNNATLLAFIHESSKFSWPIP